MIKHLTTQGERLDLLAYKYYGNALLYLPIIKANPELPLNTEIQAGMILNIPEIEIKATDTPPWKK